MSISLNSKNKNSLLITHEAVNFSPSKTTYSFAKGQRFKSLAPVGPADVFYKLPSTLKTKKITFGIGERFRQRKGDRKYQSKAPILSLISLISSHFQPFQHLKFSVTRNPKISIGKEQKSNGNFFHPYTLSNLFPTLCSFTSLVTEIPPIGTYRTLSSFDMSNRAVMPKTNFWTFGKSATREACSRVYTPGDTSPRAKDASSMPGPGSYKYKNFSIGQDARKFSFLSRTKNPLGK